MDGADKLHQDFQSDEEWLRLRPYVLGLLRILMVELDAERASRRRGGAMTPSEQHCAETGHPLRFGCCRARAA